MKSFKVVRYIILIGIIGLALSHLIPHLKDFSKLWLLREKINYYWLTIAILSQAIQYISDGWLSTVFLKMVDIRVKMKDAFRIAAINVFAAHLLPIGEAGGLAAAYHFYRKIGVTPQKFIFLTLCWTVFSHILLFFILVIPIFFLPYIPIKVDLQILFIIVAVLLICITVYLMRGIIFRKLQKLVGKYSWFKHFESFIIDRKKYQKMITKHPIIALEGLFAFFIYYVFNISTLAFSFLTFDLLPPLALIVFAYAASLLFGRIMLAPGGLGAAETSLIFIFWVSGIDLNITIGAVLIYRLISFWLPIPGGFISYYSLKKHYPQEKLIESVADL